LVDIKRPLVTLIRSTSGPHTSILSAIKVCQSTDSVTDTVFGPNDYSLIEKVIKSGHTSILEHISFTFVVEGMSLAARSQLFRHRLASYTEQSKRSVDALELGIIMPDTIKSDPVAEGLFLDAVEACYDTYQSLTDLGIPREDARYVMQVAMETSFVVTYNGRELFDSVFPDRLCRRAQWEVRETVEQMYRIAMNVIPTVYKLTGPRCNFGKCREAHKCIESIRVK
jgi:thymidylate synthase (FAD)